MAPCANILLIATNNNMFANLFTGLEYAYLHSDLVSNSYGSHEFSGESGLFDGIFAASPVPVLFSSGDTGGDRVPLRQSFHHLRRRNQPAYHADLVPHQRICLV